MIVSERLIHACFVLICSFGAITFSNLYHNRSNTLPQTYSALPTDEKYILKPRLYIWIRQLAFVIIILTNFVHPFNINVHSFHADDVIIHTSLLLSLLFDNLDNISFVKCKAIWFAVYGIAYPYFIQRFSLSLTSMDLLRLILHTIGFFSTLYEVVFSTGIPQQRPVTREYVCGLLEYWSMSHLNKILIDPMQSKVMEFSDVPPIIDSDTSSYCWNSINENKKHRYSLLYRLYILIFDDWLAQGFFQLMSDTAAFLSPIALQIILGYVSNKSETQYSSILKMNISVHTAATIFFISPFIRAICDGQNYLRGKRIGMRVRAALITAIYEKALIINLGAYPEGPGKINNLISVDVNSVQDFACYSHFLWGTLYNIILCLTLLYLVLGISSLWGLAMMMIFMVIGLIVSKQLEKYQTDVLKNKDKRMSVVNEVLNGIRIIKLFAWEDNFLAKLASARRVEVNSLKQYIYTNMIQNIMWDIAPVAVACTAFIIHVYVYHRPLSPPVGYAALTLFNALRFPLGVFPEMIASLVSARLSSDRINLFLATENVLGLQLQFHQPKDPKHIIQVKNLSLGWRTIKPQEDDDHNTLYHQLLKARDCITKILSYRISFQQHHQPPATNSSNKAVNSKYANISMIETDDHGLEMSTAIDISSHGMLFDDHDDNHIDILKKSSVINPMLNTPSTISSIDDLSSILSNISFSLPRGALIVIAGPTGCGKSSLLSGILGECQLLGGRVSIAPNTTVSYVPQQSWIQNTTLHENILFGSSYDESRYKQVLYACSLESDIKMLDMGDETEIGEKGVNLSGGQQQRVSLGRASYNHSDIIILDDPLSAVDAHVGQHIFDHLICGFLSNRTRILVTHQVAMVSSRADIIICLDSSGHIIANCPPRELKSALMNSTYTSSLSRQSSAESEALEPECPIIMSKPSQLTSSVSYTFLDSIISAVESDTSSSQLSVNQQDNVDVDDSINVMKMSSNHSIRLTSPTHASSTSTSERKGKIVDIETKRSGDVPFSVYWFYLKACGGIIATSLLISCCVTLIIVWTLQNWGLGIWLSSMQSTDHHDAMKTLMIYISCVTSVILCTITRCYLEAMYSCQGAQILHDQVTSSVIQAPCSWYDATPIGRITNRFSQDISTVDKDIMHNLIAFFDCTLGMIQVTTIISLTMPVLLLPMIPILLFTSWVANKFFRVAREIKRLESVSKSPVFVLFSETLQGLSIIRAYHHENRFFHICCNRVDDMNRCFLYLWQSNRWLNVRMQMMGAVVCGMVAYGVIYNVNAFNSTTAGLLLIYSLEFTGYLVWLARSYADAQMNLNSVERIQEYSGIIPEKYHLSTPSSLSSTSSIKPQESGVPINWPHAGDIEFKHIYLKYASTNEYVLRDVSFRAPAGKKIGIVGRTGAGKSSLIASLFRTVEPSSGELIIDGVNVLDIPLYSLRSSLAIVPQEPILFTGSIRSNLDPFHTVSDEMIWQALTQVKLADHVRNMPGHHLDEKIVAEKGSNFSVGQKQLLCMARALLKKTSILVLDECTANVDHETDAFIQDTVRNALQHITVLCIAHRLHTIAYYDIIVVMDQGSVAEYGSPLDLMDDYASIFHSMCQSTGDYDRIYDIASSASLSNGDGICV